MRSSAIRFNRLDQRRFAGLSGDQNPVHLDPVAARRIAAGQPIVHGMHLLLRMLDAQFRGRTAHQTLAIDAVFLNPAFVDEPIVIETPTRSGLVARTGNHTSVAQVTIRNAAASESTPEISLSRLRRRPLPATPKVASIDDLDGAGGMLTSASSASAARAFPSVARTLGADAVATLARLSALIGMECPGRDSLLKALHLHVTPGLHGRDIAWRVSRVDRRFGLVRLEVTGGGVRGTVDAFMRPQPVSPPPFGEAAKLVGRDEFSDQRALIVGGSRGLGAAAALLLAAGGGLPIVTFVSGLHEAHALRREIRGRHGRMETLGLDVTDSDVPSIVARAARRFDVTHVYYFATPRIFARRQGGAFDSALFAQFAAMYVDAFATVCCAAHRDGRPLDVFYPSSHAVTETPLAMTEYAAAKAAGEWLCVALERSRPGLHVLVSRLPRTATDQTASILPIAAASPLDVMLPVVREMHRRGRSRTA